jgi:hypothetical protein
MALNLGNLHQILLRGLQSHKYDLVDTVDCIISLSVLRRMAGYGSASLMDQIPNVLPQLHDYRLEVRFITELLASFLFQPVANPELHISKAISHFQHFNDPVMECGLIAYILFMGIFRLISQLSSIVHLDTSMLFPETKCPKAWNIFRRLSV